MMTVEMELFPGPGGIEDFVCSRGASPTLMMMMMLMIVKLAMVLVPGPDRTEESRRIARKWCCARGAPSALTMMMLMLMMVPTVVLMVPG